MEKKRAVAASHGTGLEKGSDIGKDLLSILSQLIHIVLDGWILWVV